MAFTGPQQLLIDRVESRIDEVTPAGQAPVVSHNTIFAELGDAANYVLEVAPADIVAWAAKDATADANGNFTNNTYATIIDLEETTIRVLSVKLDEWRRTLHDIKAPAAHAKGPDDGRQYRRQFNTYQGSTAGNPGAHLVPIVKDSRRWGLECYPLDGDATPVEKLLTVIETLPEDIPSTAGGKALHDAMIWEAASRCLTFIKQSQFGQVAAAMGAARLGLIAAPVMQTREQ